MSLLFSNTAPLLDFKIKIVTTVSLSLIGFPKNSMWARSVLKSCGTCLHKI